MLITKIPGYDWPMEVSCEGCNVNLIITECNDISFEKHYSFVPYFPSSVKSNYYVTCPVCKYRTNVPASEIPDKLRKYITG